MKLIYQILGNNIKFHSIALIEIYIFSAKLFFYVMILEN